MSCLFCGIADGSVPSKKVYEDDRALVFHDIEPAAPVHLLIIPKRHIKSAADITPENSDIVAHLFVVIAKVAKEMGLENGFRVVSNCGRDAQQSVEHLHFHLLGGRGLAWPPG